MAVVLRMIGGFIVGGLSGMVQALMMQNPNTCESNFGQKYVCSKCIFKSDNPPTAICTAHDQHNGDVVIKFKDSEAISKEVQTLLALQHVPQVAEYYDYGTFPFGMSFLVTESWDQTLAQYLKVRLARWCKS